MLDVSEVKKCRSRGVVTKSTVKIRQLIADKGSVSKVHQLATTIEEVKTKARDLTKRLDDLDPQSTESHGS